MESNQHRFPKLKGSNNYEIWSIRMEASICEKGYLDVMTLVDLSGYDEATVKELIVKRNDRTFRAAAIIRLSLEDGPLIQTRGINDALDLWNRLIALYEPTGFSSEFLTCKDLFSTTLAKCGNSVEAYLTKVKRLTDDLAAENLAIPNKVIAAYTLNNLTSDYENTVAIISQSYRTHTGDINLIELFSQLVDESRRISARESTEMAFTAANKPPTVKQNGVKKNNDKECSFCHRKGHTQETCFTKDPSLRKKQGNKKILNQSEVSLNCEIEEQALSAIGLTSPSTWILNSAATSHISAYKDQFLTI
jgi:gag-polypeptide of LTR copia-type